MAVWVCPNGRRKVGAQLASEVGVRAFAPIPPTCHLCNCPTGLEQVCNAAIACIHSGRSQAGLGAEAGEGGAFPYIN